MSSGQEMEAFLKAVDDLERGLDETAEMIDMMRGRSEVIRQAHRRGIPLREIVPREETPLLVQLLTNATNLLHAYGNRVRRTEARALHSQGLTMDEIAALFGVSRQRVSALLRERPGTEAGD